MLQHLPYAAGSPVSLHRRGHEDIFDFEVPWHGLDVLQLVAHVSRAIEYLEAYDQLMTEGEASRDGDCIQLLLDHLPQGARERAETLLRRLPRSLCCRVESGRDLGHPTSLLNSRPKLRICLQGIPQLSQLFDLESQRLWR
eukprot:3798113-Rhodomonas_salina.1